MPIQARGRNSYERSRSALRCATRARASNAAGSPISDAQLVVAQEDHVVGVCDRAAGRELPADRDEHQPDVRVGALVDVEVVVRRQRRHAQVDLVRRAHLVERIAVESVEDLARGRVDVVPQRAHRRGVVVVGLDVAANELDDRLHLLEHGREDELVAPDGVPAELALVGLDPFLDELAAALGQLQRGDDLGRGLVAEGLGQLRDPPWPPPSSPTAP